MAGDDIYTFRIAAYSPDTIPMGRLGQYLAELADVFGERDSVHFKALETGSTRILTRVRHEAVPKVRNNISGAASGDLPGPANAFKKLNDMLREDNADAQLRRGDTNIIDFPGCRAIRPAKLGPFTQGVVKDGVLVRVGGRDQTAHATIQDGDGNTWNFELSRDLARDLAPHLFGKPLRVSGSGRWFRDEDGQWQYSRLTADRFHVLDDADLATIVGRVRKLPADDRESTTGGVEMLRMLRDDASRAN